MTEQIKSEKREQTKQKIRNLSKEYMNKLGLVAFVPSSHGFYAVYKDGKVEEWLSSYGVDLFRKLNEKKG